jgi:hypothetical protein
MELTKNQTQNVVTHYKAAKNSLRAIEAAQNAHAARMSKLKESTQSSGNDQQVFAAAEALMAQAYLALPDPMEME